MLLANPASYGENFDPRGPYEPDLPGPPAKDHAGLWFLTNTALLIGASPEKIRQTLYYRRSSELMEGFRIRDPYAVCAAYLLLERDGDVLVDLNMLQPPSFSVPSGISPGVRTRHTATRSHMEMERRTFPSDTLTTSTKTRRRKTYRTRTSRRESFSRRASFFIWPPGTRCQETKHTLAV